MGDLAAIGMGANARSTAGEPVRTLSAALARLFDGSVQPVAISRFYRSPAFPAGSGPDFVNACAVVRTSLSPDALLQRLHQIEAAFGRVRTTRWGPRTLDMDLLLHGNAVLPDAKTEARWRGLDPDRQRVEAPEVLILPHPRLSDRAFVLLPLSEIAASLRHPVTGRTMRELSDALPEAAKQDVVPV